MLKVENICHAPTTTVNMKQNKSYYYTNVEWRGPTLGTGN